MRRLGVVLATLVALLATCPRPAAASAPAKVTYRPPVDAPIVDPFRAPVPENWNAGNRGLEYATTPGTPVAASAGGEVVFAGPVADGLHVVVLHDDGLRTSYSFLQSIAVHRGDRVKQGQTVGTANDRFHFGVRAGDAYLDPAKLFGGPPEVHLVPDELRRPQSEEAERAGLSRLIQGFAGIAKAGGAAAYEWARDTAVAKLGGDFDELLGEAIYGYEGNPLVHAWRFGDAAYAWWKAQETCTPASVVAPRLQERHVAVMVAGLGSKGVATTNSVETKSDSIDTVDTRALGYADGDVVRYSYLGGTTAENSYVATDTTQDIHQSAKHLRELLARVQAQHPGVPIDIIAHSQGGIVARTALTDELDGADPRLPAVRSLVTLSSPHQGAPIATDLTMAAHTKIGKDLEQITRAALPDKVDPMGPSVKQLAEQSLFMLELNMRKLPAGIHATSIGAREDLMVPASVTHLEGANNVIISAPGHLTEHSEMPSAPQTQREMALGLAGMAPTCQTFGDAMADAVVSDYVRLVEEGVGDAAYLAGGRYDSKVPTKAPRRLE